MRRGKKCQVRLVNFSYGILTDASLIDHENKFCSDTDYKSIFHQFFHDKFQNVYQEVLFGKISWNKIHIWKKPNWSVGLNAFEYDSFGRRQQSTDKNNIYRHYCHEDYDEL